MLQKRTFLAVKLLNQDFPELTPAYSVNGEALTPGLYIKRQGANATKVLVK